MQRAKGALVARVLSPQSPLHLADYFLLLAIWGI